MPMRPNPYFAGPGAGFAQGLQNLGSAIFGDPVRAGQFALQQAQQQLAEARAGKVRQETSDLEAAAAARGGFGQSLGDVLFSGVDGPGVAAPNDIMRRLPTALGQAAQFYDPKDIPTLATMILGLSGDDALARRGFAVQAKTPGEDFALTPGRADDIRRQGFDASMAEVRVQQAAQDRRHGMTVGEQRRHNMASEDISRSRPISLSERMGDVFSTLTPEQQAQRVMQGTGGGGAPLTVSPNDVAKIDMLINSMAPEDSEIDPALGLTLRTRAAEIYQGSRNAQAAVAQAWAELVGAEPATERRGGFLGIGGTPTIIPPAAPAAAAPAPAAAPSVQPGATATGPNGAKIMWNGTEWVPVS